MTRGLELIHRSSNFGRRSDTPRVHTGNTGSRNRFLCSASPIEQRLRRPRRLFLPVGSAQPAENGVRNSTIKELCQVERQTLVRYGYGKYCVGDQGISKNMGLFRRKVPRHFVPIHPDNTASNDWIILLEAGTIVSNSGEKLRVATATQERKIVKRYNAFLRKQNFLVLEGFDPRIHTLYFCPQLYQLNSDNKLVPLDGEEIGKLVAKSVRGGVVDKPPWYEPSDAQPDKPINPNNVNDHFDTLTITTLGGPEKASDSS